MMTGGAHGGKGRLKFAGHDVVGSRERRVHGHERRLVAALADNGVILIQPPASTLIGFLDKLMMFLVMDTENPVRRAMGDDGSHLHAGHLIFYLAGMETLGPGDALGVLSRIVPEG